MTRNILSQCYGAALLLLFMLIAGDMRADGFVTTKGGEIVDPAGRPLILRGINLGNWLVPEGYMFKLKGTNSPRLIQQMMAEMIGPDAAKDFWTKFRANYITRGDIQLIRRLGLNSVRVPFNYRLFTSDDAPDTWTGPGFAMLDSVISWCHEAGIYVVLDMHCAPGGQTGDNIDDSYGYPWLFENAASRALAMEVWKRIAVRYASDPTVAGYDLMNEPIATFEGFDRLNPLLEPLYREIVRGIREVDTNHVIILGGAQWDTNFGVFGPPFDSKLTYTFHRYWTDVNQEIIRSYVEFRDKHHVPIWMGESGENSDEWITSFRQLLESNNIGWCFWPFKKMDATTCLVTFDIPDEYKLITRYAESNRKTFEEIRRERPDPEKIRKILDEFLRNCRIDHCRLNAGYAEALGLTPAK